MFWIHIHNTCVSYRHCHYAQYKIHKKIAQLDADSESYALLFSLWSVFFTLWVCACACACKSYSRLVSPTDYIFIQPKLTLTTFYQQHFRKHWASKSASQRTKEKFLNKFATLCVLLDMLIISVISKPTAMLGRNQLKEETRKIRKSKQLNERWGKKWNGNGTKDADSFSLQVALTQLVFPHFPFLYCWLIQFFFSLTFLFLFKLLQVKFLPSIKKIYDHENLLKNFTLSLHCHDKRIPSPKERWVSRWNFIVLSPNFTCYAPK